MYAIDVQATTVIDGGLCCKFELQFHSLLGWYVFWKGRVLDSEVLW
jgi:hypothetical protein